MAFHEEDDQLYSHLSCFKLKKWFSAVILFLDILVLSFVFMNGIYNLFNKEYEQQFTLFLKFVIILGVIIGLHIMFLYGIVQESICLSCTYACLWIASATLLMASAILSRESFLAANWIVSYWMILVSLVAVLYVIDLWRIQKMRQNNNDTEVGKHMATDL